MVKKQVPKIIYIVIFLLVLLVPGVWTFIGSQEAIGNEEEVDFSNISYTNAPDKIDNYMSMKFGFRNQWVRMYNKLNYIVFHESMEESVIIGEDGWMFYGEALEDYSGENLLADYEIEKIAKIMSIAERAVNSYGGEFVFVSAPNKMEIYGEYMPYYLVENTDDGNYEKLYTALEEAGVSNVNLKEILLEEADKRDYRLYHKLDSHWNSLGAAIAYESIMKHVDMDYISFTELGYEVKAESITDIYSMLFPNEKVMDEDVVFDRVMDFYPITNFRSPEDLVIETVNDNRDKSLLMFRDSFGNSLYKFFAENFGEGQFLRELPYNLTRAENKDLVVIEIVERNIGNLLLYLPIVEPQKVEVEAAETTKSAASGVVTKQGGYNLITVSCEAIPQDCVNVYFVINDESYEAYPSAADGDACMYIKELDEESTLSVIFESSGKLYETANVKLQWQ